MKGVDLAVAILVTGVALPAGAATIPATGADDICPPTADPCIIDKKYEVQGTLDFGDRLVRMVPGGRLLHSTSIICRDLSVEVGARTVAFDTSEPGNVAGSLGIFCSGTVTIDGRINARGNPGGDVRISGTGGVTISGRIFADGVPLGSSGGLVMIDSYNGSVTTNDSIITHGLRGSASYEPPTAGVVYIQAGQDITINGAIESSGGMGGNVALSAYGRVFVHNGLNADGGSGLPYGNGGYIEIYADYGIQMTGSGVDQSSASFVTADGQTGFYIDPYGSTSIYPGSGGTHYIKTDHGDIVISDKVRISAHGGKRGGYGSYGGWVLLSAYAGKIVLDGKFAAKGYGIEGWGGNFFANADEGFDMGPKGEIDLRSKNGGAAYINPGDYYPVSRIDGKIDTRGLNKFGNGDYAEYGYGGTLQIEGGDIVLGGKLLNGADGGMENFALYGCRLDLLPSALINARNGSPTGGGGIFIRMDEHVIANPGSRMFADAQGGGTIEIDYGNPDKPPVLNGTTQPDPIVTGGRGFGCPVCGNSEIDIDESCDDGNVVSGDGCSDNCQDEGCVAQTPGYPAVPLCYDGDRCTNDRCDPATSLCQNIVSCEEGVACTVDACVAGACEHNPDDTLCDDRNDCTDDLCNAASGCLHVSLTGTGCEDGDLCTVTGSCDGGVCVVTDARSTGDSRFAFRFKEGQGNDKASFKTTLPLAEFTSDPILTGLVIEVRDSMNQTILSSNIPAASFESKGPGRYGFRDPKFTVPSANGVIQVKIKTVTAKGVAKFRFKVKETEMPGADGEFRISASLLFGSDPAVDECLTARFVPCEPRAGRNKCKN